MKKLKIAACPSTWDSFITDYPVVDIHHTDFTDIAAAVTSAEHAHKIVEQIRATGFGVPLFIVLEPNEEIPTDIITEFRGVIQSGLGSRHFYGKQIEAAAEAYDEKIAPPFFGALKEYVKRGYTEFDCPGHQGGQFFSKHPAGREFFNFFGETLFRADLCNADVKLGDLLIHEGPAKEAERHAAKVFNADKTYFVLNGTSSANMSPTVLLLRIG